MSSWADFVSAACKGEHCSVCGAPACRKVGEEIFFDDPSPNRHNLTAYVCQEHFDFILRPYAREKTPEPKSSALPLVLIESPYAGDVARNIKYARACMRDCLRRGEAPYASHLLFTQEGILDDTVPGDRALGIECGLLWGAQASLTAVYTDLGISKGMELGIERALREGRRIEYRTLPASTWPLPGI